MKKILAVAAAQLEPVTASSFPAAFDFQIFDPPPAVALFTTLGAGTQPPGAAQFAVGVVFAVDNVSGGSTLALQTQTVTYTCANNDDFCTAPTGNWIVIGDFPNPGGESQAVLLEVAPPNVLLGVGNGQLLMYDNAWDCTLAEDLYGFANEAELTTPGYHVVQGCTVGARAVSGAFPTSTPIDIV